MSSTTIRSARRSALYLVPLLAAAALVAGCAASGAAPQQVGAGAAAAPGYNSLSAADGLQQDGAQRASVGGDGQPAPAGRDGALIVKTGTLQIEVRDFDSALAKARTAIVGVGGYISGSQMALDGDRPYASITYRIPAAGWDDAIQALKDLGTKVVAEQTQAVDVTTAVVDLDARIDNLRATERALQAIMAKATKIPDILEVQSQLSSAQGQIEQLVAERDHFKDQAAYGTLTVGWTVPVVAVTAAQEGWDAAKVIDQAVAQLVQLGQGLFSVGIWFGIVGLPLLLGGLVLLGILLLVARRLGLGRRPGGRGAEGTLQA